MATKWYSANTSPASRPRPALENGLYPGSDFARLRAARLILSNQRPVKERTQEFRPKKDSYGHTYWAYDKSFDPTAQPIEVAEQ